MRSAFVLFFFLAAAPESQRTVVASTVNDENENDEQQVSEQLLLAKHQQQQWQARVEADPSLASNVASLKSKFARRTGGRKVLRDETIYDAIRSAWDRYEFTPSSVASPPFSDDGRNLQGTATTTTTTATTDQLIGFAISATSPGLPWNAPSPSPDDTQYYCAGAALQDPPPPNLYGVRPFRGQPLTLLDCQDALSTERRQSQILFRYGNDGGEGVLKFNLISDLDIFADPRGWCVSLDRVRKNEELTADYCDITSIEQVWRVLSSDNTWRPEYAWYDINGDGLCVETKTTVPSIGVEMHLRPCTYGDEMARQRQSWVWCYQDTQCDTTLSTPPDFTIEVDCPTTDVDSNSLRCDATFLGNLNTADDGGGGAVPPGVYDRLDECRNDPVDNKRFGSSLVYRVTNNDSDQYLSIDLTSSCRDDGDDADTYVRVYEEQSNGDWDCEYWSSTYCVDGYRAVSTTVDPHQRDFLIIVSADGTDRDQTDFDLELGCDDDEDEYEQIRLRQDPDLCFGVSRASADTPIELFSCDDDTDLLLWTLDNNRLSRLRGFNLCAQIDGAYQDGTGLLLQSCNRNRANQKWRYDRFNDNEISSEGDSRFCLTYDTGRDSPREGHSVEIDSCSGDNRQEWLFARSTSNPSPSPPTASPSDLYCFDDVTRNVEDDSQRLPTDGTYRDLSCIDPDDVFDDTSNILNTYEIVSTEGIEQTIRITSRCNGSTGDGDDDGDDDAGTTLFRIYQIVEDRDGDVEEYRCRRSGRTTCDSGTSDSLSFTLDGSQRYLVVATGVRVDVVECEISDEGCTRSTGIDDDLGRGPDVVSPGRIPEEVDPTNLVEYVWVKAPTRRRRWRRRRRRRRGRKIFCDGSVKAQPDKLCSEKVVRGQFKNELVKDVCMAGCASISKRNAFNL